MKIKIDEIDLKFKILDDKKTKAIITLDFGDFVVKGFRISESNFENKEGDKLWLTPPSYNGGGHWHPIFFMPDKDQWQKIEKRIFEEYEIKRTEHYRKKMGLSKDDWSGL